MDFEVNFRADLKRIDGQCGIDFGSIWNQCGVHFGSKLGSVWGPFWGQFGVHVGIWQGFELQTPSGPDFWPLGPILGLFLGPMLGQCWPHVASNSPQEPLRPANLGPSWGQLGATWGHLGPTWANLGHFEANLEPTWATWSTLGATWGQLGANLASFCQLRPTGGELETDVRQANHRTAASTVRNHLSKSLFETSTGQMRKGPWSTNSWISTATDERSIDRGVLIHV